MLLLKNLPLKKYWCSSYKVLFLYLSVSLNKILTGKVSIPNMIYVYGLKVCTPLPFSKGGLDRISTFRGGSWERRE